MAHERLRFPEPAPPGGRSLPNVFREPVRALTFTAAVVTVVGAVLPFMRIWEPGTGWFDITGFEQSGDGGFVLELAAVAAFLAWKDGPWNSRIAILIAGPAIIGLACVAILLDFYQSGLATLAGLVNKGGHGGFEPGYWMAMGGAIGLVATGAAAMWRARGRVSFRVSAPIGTIAGAVGGVLGAIAGFVGGSQITNLFLSDVVVGRSSMVLVIVASLLAVLGAWFGVRLATAIVPGRPRQ